MSKGNKSKRKGTANKLQLWRLLQRLDPEGNWESRTRLADGSRRPQPPTHGWDLWSEGRNAFAEAKVRSAHVTIGQIRAWCREARGRMNCTQQGLVVFRQSGSSEWWAAYPCFGPGQFQMLPLADCLELMAGQ